MHLSPLWVKVKNRTYITEKLIEHYVQELFKLQDQKT